jgi:hypothetical protein
VPRDDDEQLLDQDDDIAGEGLDEAGDSAIRQIRSLFRGTPEATTKIASAFCCGASVTVRRLGTWWADDKVPHSLVLAAAAWATTIWSHWAVTLEIATFVICAFTAREVAPDAAAAPEAGEREAAGRPEPIAPGPAMVHALTASLTAGGDSVLLTRLAAELAASHPGWEPSTKAVRALLAGADIPVRDGVRTPHGNGPGVHHQDVPPLLSPSVATPLPGVVANVGAGQSANANANNAEEWTTQEGFVMRAHPDEPAQTIVVGRTNTA